MKNKNKGTAKTIREKSRSDDTLLTVGFNLRTRDAIHSPQSPAGTTQWRNKVSSLRDFGRIVSSLIRRLKPTVNRVPSLRDFAPSLAERGVGGRGFVLPLSQHYYKFYPIILFVLRT